jgi:hypothetical protein
MEAVFPIKTPSPGASPVAWSQHDTVLHFVASMAAGQGRRSPDGEGRSSGEWSSVEPAHARLRHRRAEGERSGGGRLRAFAAVLPAARRRRLMGRAEGER